MVKRSKSSARWLAEHASDEFVKRAQREGWRSRAVFKLAEIQQSERLLRPGMRCVDLGAAPGGWSQYAARIIGGTSRIVATDILPMDAIPGVDFVQGDFRDEGVLEQVLARVGAAKVDLVLSDMAPNMAGIDAVDQPRSMYLAELALEFADRVLAPGGDVLGEAVSRRRFRCRSSEMPGVVMGGWRRKSQRRHERAVLRSICWRGSLGWCKFDWPLGGTPARAFLS